MTGASMRVRPTQSGQSLISLLVGLTLGVIMLGAMSAMYYSLKTSFNEQVRFARLTAIELRLMDSLTHTVQTAGFYPFTEYNGMPRTLFASAPNWSAGQALGGTSGNGLVASIFRTRFRIDGREQIRDCGGALELPGAATMFAQALSVNNAGELECAVYDASGVQTKLYSLAKSVTGFMVSYGVDDDADGNVDQYLDATAVDKARAWTRVATVKFALTLAHGLRAGEPPQTLTHVVKVMNRD